LLVATARKTCHQPVMTEVHTIARQCQWLGDDGLAKANRILDFLDSIGISVGTGEAGDSAINGMTVWGDVIILDPAIPAWPGDLLHEAGHISMTEPSLRGDQEAASHDPAEEMGAMAWSAAAAVHLGFELETVFHPDGYRGQSLELIDSFRSGRMIGMPFLAWLGMTAEPHRAAEQGIPAYPVMQRWLR
jgi:hypothetical protein